MYLTVISRNIDRRRQRDVSPRVIQSENAARCVRYHRERSRVNAKMIAPTRWEIREPLLATSPPNATVSLVDIYSTSFKVEPTIFDLKPVLQDTISLRFFLTRKLRLHLFVWG